MSFAVQAAVAFQNAARRDGVLGNLNTRLAPQIAAGTATVTADTFQNGQPGLYAEVRFATAAERDQFWTDLVATLGSGPQGPSSGRWWKHDCGHDTGGPCTNVVEQLA